MRFVLRLVVLTMALAGSARASAEAALTAPGPWRHVASRDFERDQPGLGFSRRFQSPQGWIDVFAYDLGRTWADGIADPGFADLLAQTLAEIRDAGRREHGRDIEPASAEDALIAGVPLRHVTLHYETASGPVESHLFLTCLNGKIMKLRASLREPLHPDARADLLAFVGEQVRFFREAEPRAAPAGVASGEIDPAPPRGALPADQRISIALNGDVLEGDPTRGAFAILFLGSRLRHFEENGWPAVEPGRPLRPAFADELAAYTATLAFARELQGRDQEVPVYWQRLQAVQDAGFLREYLVRYRRRRAPRDEAATLRLDEFAAWARRHLQNLRHDEVDQYGQLVVNPP